MSTKEVEKKETKMAVQKFDDWHVEESDLVGNSTVETSLFSAFDYVLKMNEGVLVLHKGDQEVQRFEKNKPPKLIILKEYVNYRLHRAVYEGQSYYKANRKEWKERDEEIVGISVGAPGQLLQGSMPSVEWLLDASQKARLEKRWHLIVTLPGILPAGEYAAMTLGASSLESRRKRLRTLQMKGIPLSSVLFEPHLVAKESSEGEKFTRCDIEFFGGEPQAYMSQADWRTKVRPVVEAINRQYMDYARQLVESRMPVKDDGPDSFGATTTQATPLSDEDQILNGW